MGQLAAWFVQYLHSSVLHIYKFSFKLPILILVSFGLRNSLWEQSGEWMLSGFFLGLQMLILISFGKWNKYVSACIKCIHLYLVFLGSVTVPFIPVTLGGRFPLFFFLI